MKNQTLTQKWTEKEIFFIENGDKVYISTEEPVEIGDDIRKAISDLEAQNEYCLERLDEIRMSLDMLSDDLSSYEEDETELVNEYNNN